jgi:hypothetical protein
LKPGSALGGAIRQAVGACVGHSEYYPEFADRRCIVASAFEGFDGVGGVAFQEKNEAGDFPVDGRSIGVEPQCLFDGRTRLGVITCEQLNVANGRIVLAYRS